MSPPAKTIEGSRDAFNNETLTLLEKFLLFVLCQKLKAPGKVMVLANSFDRFRWRPNYQ